MNHFRKWFSLVCSRRDLPQAELEADAGASEEPASIILHLCQSLTGTQVRPRAAGAPGSLWLDVCGRKRKAAINDKKLHKLGVNSLLLFVSLHQRASERQNWAGAAELLEANCLQLSTFSISASEGLH